MAKLKNTHTSSVIFKNANGVDFSIPVGSTLTVLDAQLTYDLVDSAIANGWLEVTSDAGDPFFDNFGNVIGSGGSGGGGSSGGGCIIPTHTHAISDVVGLQDALDTIEQKSTSADDGNVLSLGTDGGLFYNGPQWASTNW